jgi:hypothetical protein
VLSLNFFYVFAKLELYKPNSETGEEIHNAQENPIPVLDAYGYVRIITPQTDQERGHLVMLDPVFEEDDS